jgi:hypothetical protein
MLSSKNLLFVFALLIMILSWPLRSSSADDRESQQPTMQSEALSPHKFGPLRLIATDVAFPEEGFILVPTNPRMVQCGA